jgi:hypothetical protein
MLDPSVSSPDTEGETHTGLSHQIDRLIRKGTHTDLIHQLVHLILRGRHT